jgi:hypothetical protein
MARMEFNLLKVKMSAAFFDCLVYSHTYIANYELEIEEGKGSIRVPIMFAAATGQTGFLALTCRRQNRLAIHPVQTDTTKG